MLGAFLWYPQHRSCVVIVRDLVDSLTKEGYTDADEEQKELKKLRDEAGEWVKLADILLGEVAKRRGEEEREEEEISGDNVSYRYCVIIWSSLSVTCRHQLKLKVEQQWEEAPSPHQYFHRL